MSSDDHTKRRPSWWKDTLSGFIAWVIAFAIYMIPAFAVAIPMGFDLGPKLHNNAEVSRRISQVIGEMYGSNLYIRIGYIAILGIVVFWRSWAIAGHSIERTVLHGAIIGSAAAIMVIVQMASSGVGIHAVIPVMVSIAAGVFGGIKRFSHTTAQ